MRYADPNLCPGCRSDISDRPPTCPSCDVPLRHPLAAQVYGTLLEADSLVASLRAAALEPAPLPTYPAPAPPAAAERRGGLRVSSVPGVLLSLGALCLLVAAVTFLTLAWSWLGIGGRTAILVGLTLTAAALAVRLHRRDLRVAAESLATVALGLVVLDAVGAIDAGWVGDVELLGTLSTCGLALGGAGLVLMRLAPGLLAAQAAVGVGAGLVVTAFDGLDVPDAAYAAGAAVAFALVARAALGTRVLVPLAAAQAALWWTGLALMGLESAGSHPSVGHLWLQGHGYAAATAITLLLLPGLLLGHRLTLLAGACAAATLGTALLGLPAVDASTTVIGVVALGALVAWTAAAVLLPGGWQLLAAGPSVLAGAVATAVMLDVLAVVLGRLDRAPWSVPADALLAVPDPVTSPLLLLPLAGALVAAAAVWLPTRLPTGVVVAVLGLAGAATLASYDVPLALLVAVVGGAALATRSPVLAVAAVVVALPSAGLAAAACLAAAAVGVLLRRSVVGDVLLPAAVALGVTSALQVAALDPALRAYPVLALLGLLALARTRPALEATAASCGALAALLAVDGTTSLAVHLTLAGVLVTASGVLHQHRRVLLAPGALLLAAATWVRLADLGVTAPEPYTLPLATCLVAGAVARLRLDAGAPTRLLVPGLALATVPSLLWVLDDPVGPRTVLLGGACLAMVLVGTRLRWTAPVAVGATVGAAVVVRELAPYAAQTPQWLLIGLAGTLLTVVGVTWEQRVQELRRTAAYLGRFR